MKVQDFLEHHAIARNPFAEEDAQTDPVFKEFCIESTFHPAWDYTCGDPSEPAASLIFRDMKKAPVKRHAPATRPPLGAFQREASRSPAASLVHYDDFNPFLDRFRDRLGQRNRQPERVLKLFKLWDHMDAILSLAVTGLVDRVLDVRPAECGRGICKISTRQ